MKDCYWLGISRIPGWGARSLARLMQHFQSAEELWFCSAQLLSATHLLTPVQVQAFLSFRETFEPERELEHILSLNIDFVHLHHLKYPDRLRNLYDPPTVLYFKGDIDLLEGSNIAIVGSRKASSYGRGVAEQMAKALSSHQLTIVSGLAKGIDTAAHQGALSAGGKTIAVLGCGVDVCYPRQNAEIYQTISQSGLLVSEFPPSTPPDAKNFPIRNRIISGLCLGVVVVEAAQKSGSLITADMALEQGRDVFAVPGPITSANSRGTNRLIKQGAILVEEANDVLSNLGFGEITDLGFSRNGGGILLTSEEQQLIELLSGGPVHIDQLAEDTGCPVQHLNSMLLLMEVKSLIKKLPGSYYQTV